MSYSSLNTARSAVSNLGFDIGQNPNHVSIGKHFLLSKYLKGVFHEIKPVPKYRSIWSVDPVLDYLCSLWPLDKLPLKELSLRISPPISTLIRGKYTKFKISITFI